MCDASTPHNADECDVPPPLVEVDGEEAPRSVHKEKPCSHNEWDNIRVKKGIIMLRCRTCQLQWKTPSKELHKCRDFDLGQCSKGSSCRFIHIRWYKSAQRNELPPAEAAPLVAEPVQPPVAQTVSASQAAPAHPQQQQQQHPAPGGSCAPPVAQPYVMAPQPAPVVMAQRSNVVQPARVVMMPQDLLPLQAYHHTISTTACFAPRSHQAMQHQAVTAQPQLVQQPTCVGDDADKGACGGGVRKRLVAETAGGCPEGADMVAVWDSLPADVQQVIRTKIRERHQGL